MEYHQKTANDYIKKGDVFMALDYAKTTLGLTETQAQGLYGMIYGISPADVAPVTSVYKEIVYSREHMSMLKDLFAQIKELDKKKAAAELGQSLLTMGFITDTERNEAGEVRVRLMVQVHDPNSNPTQEGDQYDR